MISAVVLVVLLGALAYFRAPVLAWTVGLAAWLAALQFIFHCPLPLAAWAVFAVVAAVLNLPPLRRAVFTGPVFGVFKKITPAMSQTEQEAINAGTVWWDRDLFSGKPDWNRLLSFPDPKLTPEEQAFIDGPTEQLCAMIDDWKITHELKDLPPEVWQFIKDNGFLGMIVKKQYGGLEFSNYAHAKVVTKIATRGGTAAVSVMVPNSLGPGELLQHYGTEEQKDYYLPRLAKGLEIPCFALTSPYAGSDAGSIPDYGIVCRGSYTHPRTGERFDDVLGLRVSWEKRWITLAPVATILGLAFKMYDPEHLLGDKEDLGITCALVPTEHEGVAIGRRHFPGGAAFMNGPTWGKDVFIPLDWIIGGREFAGQGWRMLVECLSVGRCISLPAMSVASGKMSTFVTGAYARIRDQFGLPIGKFEGVDEAMARIGGYTYQMEASQDLALTGLDAGEKPSVLSAILKYHNTERMRKAINDAMDIHGGKAVVLGPRNYLARAYQAIPIGITVEGANILTRSMIIYGQGAIRCHPFVLREMKAAMANDGKEFDAAITGHINFVISNVVRSLWLGLSGARFAGAPRGGEVGVYYRRLTRFSSAFALLSDMAMFSLGGSLKFREKLSARLGDMLSGLYIASACLKRFERDGAPKEDLAVLQWSVENALYDVQQAMDGFLANLPSRMLAAVLRKLIFPWGLTLKPASDRVGTQVARAMMEPGATRERLTRGMYLPKEEGDAVGVLAHALEAVLATEPLEQKLRKLARDGKFVSVTARERLAEALAAGLLTQAEFDAVSRARKLKRDVIMVDDFDKMLEQHDDKLLQRLIF
ncbi:acyl-CoA dehydrogenase [Chromobacterium haemolyticum]|uniref:Acyl-coenzyme A dehydrogenase n=2 Tax=Chromobacterium haemolyticum TaxID=394935 RepID=A0ABS3GKM4_9NEIS|nr:acyl-CoA dehydrogenase [Chromobacterium haemolyticum]MBK0414226.1 acyl-CoA dehydrogenase [Chromobacterium haemolyticum]MBO0415605.1 acyl-CoA dehydrogenase [Chromobacterium haemolyticum]MBO0498879.1 acyl-CoA dehydrogenase [Chromobacterium haemolyticum]